MNEIKKDTKKKKKKLNVIFAEEVIKILYHIIKQNYTKTI